MELGELKVFVTVAAEHSFSRAAIKLCRTQPAVSQAIRRLEEDLGERLFDRSTKSADADTGRRCTPARGDPVAANGGRSGGNDSATLAARPRGPADRR
jgi:hypothetical protein